MGNILLKHMCYNLLEHRCQSPNYKDIPLMFLELQTDGTASNTRIIRATRAAHRHAVLDVLEEKHETQLYLELPYALLELICERNQLGFLTSVKLSLHATEAESEELADTDLVNEHGDFDDEL